MNEKLLDIYNNAIKEQCDFFYKRYREVIADSNPQKRFRIIEKLVEKLESEFNATPHDSSEEELWNLNLCLIEQLENYPTRSFSDNLAKARDEYFNNRHFKITDKIEGFDFVAKLGTYRAWHSAGIPMFIMGERPLFEIDDDNPYSLYQPTRVEIFANFITSIDKEKNGFLSMELIEEPVAQNVMQNRVNFYQEISSKIWNGLVACDFIYEIEEQLFLENFLNPNPFAKIDWKGELFQLVYFLDQKSIIKYLPASFLWEQQIKSEHVANHFNRHGKIITAISVRQARSDTNNSRFVGIDSQLIQIDAMIKQLNLD